MRLGVIPEPVEAGLEGKEEGQPAFRRPRVLRREQERQAAAVRPRWHLSWQWAPYTRLELLRRGRRELDKEVRWLLGRQEADQAELGSTRHPTYSE